MNLLDSDYAFLFHWTAGQVSSQASVQPVEIRVLTAARETPPPRVRLFFWPWVLGPCRGIQV